MKSCSGLSFIHSIPRMTLMKRAGSDRIRDSMLELVWRMEFLVSARAGQRTIKWVGSSGSRPHQRQRTWGGRGGLSPPTF